MDYLAGNWEAGTRWSPDSKGTLWSLLSNKLPKWDSMESAVKQASKRDSMESAVKQASKRDSMESAVKQATKKGLYGVCCQKIMLQKKLIKL